MAEKVIKPLTCPTCKKRYKAAWALQKHRVTDKLCLVWQDVEHHIEEGYTIISGRSNHFRFLTMSIPDLTFTRLTVPVKVARKLPEHIRKRLVNNTEPYYVPVWLLELIKLFARDRWMQTVDGEKKRVVPDPKNPRFEYSRDFIDEYAKVAQSKEDQDMYTVRYKLHVGLS